MSSADKVGEAIQKTADICKNVFWRASESDVEVTMTEENERRERTDADAEDIPHSRKFPSQEGIGPPDETIEAGQRAPHWFERIENMVEENRDRSIQNKNLLDQIDIRTVWIARILVGLLATVVGGTILQLLIV